MWRVLSWCAGSGCDFVVLDFVNLWVVLVGLVCLVVFAGFGSLGCTLDSVVDFGFGLGLLVWSLVIQCGGGWFRLDFCGSGLRGELVLVFGS